MFDFRRIALFCLEKRPSKPKMTMFSKNLGGMASLVPPGYAYVAGSIFFQGAKSTPEKRQQRVKL